MKTKTPILAVRKTADGWRVIEVTSPTTRRAILRVMGKPASERSERCEGGCRAEVTHYDYDGVPLCDACWKSLVADG